MDAAKRQRLADAGIDVDSALERFMGNEKLLDKFLGKFPADQNYTKLVEAIAAGDNDAALTASHTLKGVCGNLSMTALFELVNGQLAAMRAGQWEKAFAMMDEITPLYEKVVAAVSGQ